ncbi:MAG: hypothetical protein IPP29_13325 [Bacteroidetes bacterium]|nr:hypothetical protein [Bacteroidota bacterium]
MAGLPIGTSVCNGMSIQASEVHIWTWATNIFIFLAINIMHNHWQKYFRYQYLVQLFSSCFIIHDLFHLHRKINPLNIVVAANIRPYNGKFTGDTFQLSKRCGRLASTTKSITNYRLLCITPGNCASGI